MLFLEKIRSKLRIISKLNDLFNNKERLQFLFVVVVALFMAIFQAVNIASILPFINMVMNQEIITSNHWLRYIYDFFEFRTKNSFIMFSGFTVIFLLLVGNAISALSTWMKIHFAWSKNHTLSSALLKKYLSMPYAYFLNQNTADLGKNILLEVQQLTIFFILPLTKIITDSVVALFILLLLLYVNPLMTLIAATILGISYLFIYLYFSNKLKIGGKMRLMENTERSQVAAESLSGIKDIKVFLAEKYFWERFCKHSKSFSELQSWYQTVGQVPRYLMETLAFGGIIGVVIFSISSDVSFQKIIPLVSFFAFAVYRLIPALQEIFNSLTIIRFNGAVLDKIHKDMSGRGLVNKSFNLERREIEPVPFKKEIKLENIYFSYPNSGKEMLENINLEIEKNSFVALIGETGSGKTTLVDLTLGLFFPSKGSLKVDGLNIDESNIKNWQAILGYVPQQIYLSDDTFTRNIAFGLPDDEIDMDQVKKVAQMANLDGFIENELNMGYNTIIGERGVRLSGGQRQRIGIARALYHNPEVLIFDEATSSLDNKTEEDVLKAIEGIAKTKTMIVIAHRLTTVKNCGKVYVINKGRIINEGSYDEMIAKRQN